MAASRLPSTDEVKKAPGILIDLAIKLTKKEIEIPDSFTQDVKDDLPYIDNPEVLRDKFWELFGCSKRVEGVEWLHAVGFLEKLIPCWSGNPARQRMRMSALRLFEQESWRPLLDEKTNTLIDTSLSYEIEGRITREGLTGLAILLAGGDTENQAMWTKSVRRCLHDLGATEAEILWVEGIVGEYRRGALFFRGELDSIHLTPQLAVTLMTTMVVAEEDTDEAIKIAAERAQKALENYVSPLDLMDDDDD